jgi:hypothetical protein
MSLVGDVIEGETTAKPRWPESEAWQRATLCTHSPGAGNADRTMPLDAKNRPERGKISAQKKRWIACNFTEQDVEREQERAWIQRLLEEPDAAEVRREAAYQEPCEEEECRDLAGKFARKSAKKTGDAIGGVRDRYEAIALEFICLRVGKTQSLLHYLRGDYETDAALREFLVKFGKWVGRYVFSCIDREQRKQHWALHGYPLGTDLMNALAQEYVRDRNGLMRFLTACFERWRELSSPHHHWRERVLTHQLAGKPSEIRDALIEVGVVNIGEDKHHESRSLHSRIRQYLLRDRRGQ